VLKEAKKFSGGVCKLQIERAEFEQGEIQFVARRNQIYGRTSGDRCELFPGETFI